MAAVLLKTHLKQKDTDHKLEAYIKEIRSDGTVVAYLAGSRKAQVFPGCVLRGDDTHSHSYHINPDAMSTEYSLCMDRATECVLLALVGAIMKPK